MSPRTRLRILELAGQNLGIDDIVVKLRKKKLFVARDDVRRIVLDRDVEEAERQWGSK